MLVVPPATPRPQQFVLSRASSSCVQGDTCPTATDPGGRAQPVRSGAVPGGRDISGRPQGVRSWELTNNASTSIWNAEDSEATHRRQSARRLRWERRRVLWRESRLPRLKSCGRVPAVPSRPDANSLSGHYVSVRRRSADGTAFAVGMAQCGSVWACPVCSANIRQRRAKEIEAAVNAHWNTNGSVLFLTLTVRHIASDSLADLLTGLRDAWSKVTTGRAWVNEKAALGIVGFVRTVEITYGDPNSGGAGWHPHIHALLFLAGDVDPFDVEALEGSIYARWERAVVRAGVGKPSRAHGIRLQFVKQSRHSLGDYLNKVIDARGEEQSVGMEMTRGDLKADRGDWGQGLHPFEFLDIAAANRFDSPYARRLWNEYETATRGLHCLTWSRGLVARLLPEGVDVDENKDSEEVAQVPFILWRKACWIGAAVEILEVIEDGGTELTVRALLCERLSEYVVTSHWPQK